MPAKKECRSFEEARKFVQGLNLKNKEDWKAFSRSEDFPSDFPKDPYSKYRKKN